MPILFPPAPHPAPKTVYLYSSHSGIESLLPLWPDTVGQRLEKLLLMAHFSVSAESLPCYSTDSLAQDSVLAHVMGLPRHEMKVQYLREIAQGICWVTLTQSMAGWKLPSCSATVVCIVQKSVFDRENVWSFHMMC